MVFSTAACSTSSARFLASHERPLPPSPEREKWEGRERARGGGAGELESSRGGTEPRMGLASEGGMEGETYAVGGAKPSELKRVKRTVDARVRS